VYEGPVSLELDVAGLEEAIAKESSFHHLMTNTGIGDAGLLVRRVGAGDE
jgi:hypothetical protein